MHMVLYKIPTRLKEREWFSFKREKWSEETYHTNNTFRRVKFSDIGRRIEKITSLGWRGKSSKEKICLEKSDSFYLPLITVKRFLTSIITESENLQNRSIFLWHFPYLWSAVLLLVSFVVLCRWLRFSSRSIPSSISTTFTSGSSIQRKKMINFDHRSFLTLYCR